VDIDLAQDRLPGVNEAVRRIRGNDHDATGFHFARLITDRDGGAAFESECNFNVRMCVQWGPWPGFALTMKAENGAPCVSPTNSYDIPTNGSSSRLRKLMPQHTRCFRGPPGQTGVTLTRQCARFLLARRITTVCKDCLGSDPPAVGGEEFHDGNNVLDLNQLTIHRL
jgi:hypothetical protein